MFFTNDWMQKRLFNLIKFEAEGGSGGGSGEPDGDNKGSDGNEGSGSPEKTFTQEQVNSMIAAEKRKNFSSVYKGLGFESEEAAKAFVEKYKEEEEKNKTDLVKAQERAAQLEAEKNTEAAKAQDLQYKFDAMAEGCDAKSAGDVVVLAKAKMTEDKDFAAALKEVKKQYPSMFGQTTGGAGGTGGGGTAPRGKMSSKDAQGMGARLAKQRRENNAITKNTEYFK